MNLEFIQKWKSKTNKKIISFFITTEAGQKRPHKKNLGRLILFLGLCVVFSLVFRAANQDTSELSQISRIDFIKKDPKTLGLPKISESVKGLFKSELSPNESTKEIKPPKKQKVSKRPSIKIKYKAPQIIRREDSLKSQGFIPMGSKFIGKLLTPIDTRHSNQFYKVLLLYGARFKKAFIPRGSILFGKVKYSGQGEKVFISFTKGIYTNGYEFKIAGQALDPKDYSLGLTGRRHSQFATRLATTLGLSAVSGVAATLTQKQPVGVFGHTVVEPNTKNAIYAGLSQTAQEESQRQAQRLNNTQAYVTIKAGVALIVNLTSAYRGE